MDSKPSVIYWIVSTVAKSHCILLFSSYTEIKKRVWNGRLESPLFNIRQYAHDMEVVYAKMWNRYSNNLAADHIMS